MLQSKVMLVAFFFCSFMFYSCDSNSQEHSKSDKEHRESNEHDKKNKDGSTKVSRGEHSRDKGEGGEGEEDGTQLSLDSTYDVTKKGVRLILKYDKEINSFVGSMENISNKTVKKARVEVHLSNGIELGPTTPINLAPKAKQDLIIKATEKSFEGWSTHAEIGSSEHGKEGKEH